MGKIADAADTINQSTARALWKKANDDAMLTEVEKKTLIYIRTTARYTRNAAAIKFFNGKMGELPESNPRPTLVFVDRYFFYWIVMVAVITFVVASFHRFLSS